MLGSGDISFDPQGRAREDVGDMITVLDPQTNEMDFISVKDVKLDHVETAEDYGNKYRQYLQELNSKAYAEAQAEQAQQEGNNPPKEGTNPPSNAGNNPPSEGNNPPKEGTNPPSNAGNNPPSEGGNKSTLTFSDGTPVPLTKDSKGRDVGDYSKMTPQQAAEYIKMTFGENAEKAIDGKIKRAEAAVKAADKMKVDYSADEGDAIEAEAKKKAAMEAAQKELTFFTTVKNIMKQTDAKEQAGGGGLTGNRYDQWRKEGYHIGEGGVRYDRQKKEDMTGVYGRDVQVDFTPTVGVKGRAKVVEVDSVQASHVNGQVNPMHFGPDWQPKDRTDAASKLGQDKALTNFDPEKITGDGNAFIGSSPSVNERHEVIQGNNRVEILRRLYDEQPEKAAAYKQWLIDHAAEFGYDPAEIAKMKRPVLVNELPVDDATAKELGQYRASDFESGGKEIPRASVVINRLGEKMQNVANILLNQGSLPDDAKMSDLIAQNANKVLEFLAKEGVLSATEQQTLRKDSTTMRQWMEELLKANLFDGDKETEAAFNQLPDNARRAVLATYMRDAKSDDAAKIKQNLQHSFEAYVQMMNDPAFANAKNVADARAAVAREIEKGNESLFGEAPLREKFSNFELELAALYKGLKDQKTLKGLLTKYFDAVQGDKAIGRQLEIGEEPRDAISKDDAIKEVFGLHDSKPAETQRQVDEAVKGLITEITKQVGDDFVVTDEDAGQERIARAEGEQGEVDPVLKDAYNIYSALSDRDKFSELVSKYLYPNYANFIFDSGAIFLADPVKAVRFFENNTVKDYKAGEKVVKPGMLDAWGKIVNAISHREFGGADKPQGNYTKLRFQIKTPEQRKAAENAYNWAVENRPDDRVVYAVVNMDKPNAVPTYFEKKDFAAKFARYYGKELGYGNYKLINIEKTFEENVKGLRGVFPEEFDTRPVEVKEKEQAEKAAAEAQHRETVLRDEVVDTLKNNGMDVSMNTEEGQKVLDEVNEGVRMSAKKRRALETVSVSRDKKHQPTVVSSADGANVLNNLEQTKKKYEKQSNRSNTFIGDVAKALGTERFGSGSEYATFETKNGQIVTIRLANHNAHVSGFDHNGRDNGISIVISPKPNEGITNDGNAHIVEFYYDSIKLRRADGKPLAEIVRSIEQALYSGEFKDTTGLAERQEVNAEDIARLQKVYHGSQADFDHFDHSHMGEGEGAQAYGWGTYVTEVEGIGRSYAIQNSKNPREHYVYNGETHGLSEKRINEILEVLLDAQPSEGHVVSEYNDALDWYRNNRDEYSQSLVKDASLLNPSDISIVVDKTRNLYTLEIPDDTGENYIDYNGRISDIPSQKIDGICKELEKLGWKRKDLPSMVRLTDGYDNIVLNPNATGADLYEEIKTALKSDKQASLLLSRAGFVGIKYPADFMRGGREDGAKNYVIFNENDAKITDHVRFFRTANGEAYGFTVGGKIYIDPRIANSETPIHEYAHLWASALKRGNAKEWKNVVGLMKETKVWDDVVKNYPELKDDDAIADEVIATYSGRRGAERLRKMAEDVPSGKAFEKAEAISTIAKVKRALDKFWKGVADMLHIHYTSAEEVADRVMKDLLDGVDPRKAMEEAVEANDGDMVVKHHRVRDEKELEELNKAETFRMFSGMQERDGKLYSPMAAIIDGKRTDATEIGVWMKADERPDLVKNGKFNLVKTDGNPGAGEGTVPARYNPYMHTSSSMMNDQFSGAYARGNIKIVEWEIPESEKTSGYRAEGAKDAVGLVPWHSGSVNSLLPKDRQRSVMLSRWRKAVRVVPDSEVAASIAKQLEGTDLSIPWNVVTPNQLRELVKLGVPVTTKETGTQSPETKEAFFKQKAELEKEFPDYKFTDVKMTKDAYKEWGKGSVKKSTAKKRLFRTKDGEVYGFTDGEKIYLDTKKMKPETPLHEYTHLWSDALRRVNPKEWEHVKGLFDKVDGLKEEVKKLYPELEGDDLYDEMIAVFSGREGAKKVEDVVRRLAAEDGKSVTESAKAMGFIERVKTALKAYWKGVADLLHIHFTTAEEVADKVLADWAGGFDPRKVEARKEPKKKPKEKPKKTPEELRQEMEENPLTEEEIDSYSTGDEDMDTFAKEYAKDYLNGDKNPMTEFYYTQIYNDVRNRRQDGEGDSSPADPSHVDGGGNEPAGPGAGGGEFGPVGGNTGGGNVPGELPGKKGGENSTAVFDGKGGDKPMDPRTPPVEKLPAGGGGPGRGGNTGRAGATGGEPGTPPNDKGGAGETKQDAEARAKQSGDAITDILAKIGKKRQEYREKDAGTLNAYPGLTAAVIGELSKKMLPRDKEEMILYGQLMKACAQHAYDVLRVYGEKIENWFKGMRDELHEALKDAYGDTLTDEDIDNYIRSLWNTNYTIDGRRQTIEKWAAEIGREKLRAALSVSLEEKRKKQQEAEKVEVKVGDADNIAESLPFLLPEQQNDVLKAETQFFDPTHADDSHGNGRGILFTNGTGTGKTYTGLGIAKRFIKQGKGRVLIVTPSPAKVQDWSNDAKNLGITLTPLKGEAGKGATMQKGEGAVVTTFANFRQNRALMEDVFDLIIYDESHKLMENRQAQESATTTAHYRMTNKDFSYAMERIQLSHPLWRESEELDAERSKLLKGNASVESARLDPEVSDESIQRIEQIDARLQEIDKEKAKVMPELTKQANESVGKTKVVFLSATPFNLRENLEYAEGYLFKYNTPTRTANITENEWQAMRRDARNQFYRQWFPHGERIGKSGKVEPYVSDADKNDVEERKFADHLMELGVMSGRTIDNGYDYSRDFPTISITHADRFNTAVKELMGSKELKAAAEKVFNDYNTMSVVYETMKASACAERIKEHMAMGRKVVVFHRRVNDRKGLAQPPFANVLTQADLYASALERSGGDGRAEALRVRKAMAEFQNKYADLLQWEQTLDYRMPRQQIASLLGDLHDYTPAEMMARNDAQERLIGPAFSGKGDPYKAGYEFAKTCFDLEDADVVEMYRPHEISDEEAETLGIQKPSKAQHKKELDAYNAIAKQVRKGIEDNIRERIASGELKIELDANGKKVRHVGMFAGADSVNAKLEDMKLFNSDDSGMDVMVVQEASGKEGISLHDTTGKHQRVMINLALPQSPIAFIQAEGRIYRIGQKSNAIFEYPLLGIDNEIALFAGRFNGRAATTENLALGNMARGLKDAITRGVMTKRGKVPLAGQGYGGREWDLRDDQRATGYDGAVRDWREENKDEQTGTIDDMDTPQPIGFKLVEWAKTNEGETVLEPSAGNGNVSRYLPSNAKSLSIEPDPRKYNNLMLRIGGVERGSAEAAGRRTLTMNGKFEDLSAQNKFDTIIMNSPNGAEGETAKKHLELAVAHLNDSGRIVAVLPETESIDKFVADLVDGNPALRVTGEVKLPACAFSVGGVSQKTRVITIDKLTREEMRKSWKEKQTTDLSDITDIETLVKKMKGVKMPDRVLDPAAKSMRYANMLKTKLESIGVFKNGKSRWSGVAVSDKSVYINIPSKFYNTLNYDFYKGERNGRPFTISPITMSGNRYEAFKNLDIDVLAQYKASTEILKMSDAEIREKCFNWRLKDKDAPLYVDALKQYSEAMAKMIRGISGRTDDQLLRASNGEDIDNPVQVKAGTQMSVGDYKALFEANNENEELGALFNRVYEKAKNLGLKIDVFEDKNTSTSAYYSGKNYISINTAHWNAKKIVNERGQVVPATKAVRAEVLCHELIHSVTSYANYWYDHAPGRLPEGLREAAKELDDIYNKIIGSKESYLIPSYAKENKNELVAEMANPAVREPLKKMGMWTRLVNAVKKFFTGEEKQVAVDAGFAKEEDFGQSTVYNELSKTLDKFLNNFDEKSYDAYVALCGGERHGKHFRTEDKNSQSSTPVTDTVANIGKVVEKTSKKLGVKVHAVSHISEITDPQVRRDIMRGKKVQG